MGRHQKNQVVEYITVEEFMNVLEIKNRGATTLPFVEEKIKKYGENIGITVDDSSITLINKNDVINFKNNYVSIAELRKEIPNNTLRTIIKRNDINVVKFQETVATGMFVLKKEAAFTEYFEKKRLKNNPDYINKTELAEILGVPNAINHILEEYNVKVIKNDNVIYVTRDDLAYLLKEQEKAKSLLNDYYLGSEVQLLLERNFTLEEAKFFQRKKFPLIIPHDNAADKSAFLWKKDDVDAYLEARKVREMKKVQLKTPYETFIYRLNNEYQENTETVSNTYNLWMEFIKNKFSLNTSETTQFRRIGSFIETTKTLFDNIDAEIYAMTTNEINLRLFNYKVNITHRFLVYLFVKTLYETFEHAGKNIKYNLATIINPYNEYESTNPHDTSCYSVEEYQQLFDYAKQVDKHKIKAVLGIKSYLESGNKRKYKNYDSVWLYITTLLSNNWRHGTVISQIPNVDLSRTRITGLDWFLENNLTINEAKDIVYQVGRHVINIEKTGAEGTFRVPEALEIPFATAIAICELRVREIGVDGLDIINIPSDKTINSKTAGSFFKNYHAKEFSFDNRKMNRTLTTFIWSIIRQSNNNEKAALNAAQTSREHFNESTTNIYIKLNREQLDELTSQLFSRDQFGFVNKLFSDLLFGESDNKKIETERILAIKENFGDVFKVEATLGFVNRLIQERIEVEDWIHSKSPEEMWDDYYAILTNQLPAKEKHYQCIKRDCVKPEISSCADCPFSIPNIYALTTLAKKYIKQIENMTSFNEFPLGERMRQTHQMFSIISVFNEARNQFGDEIVYSFIEGGRDYIKQLQGLIPPKKEIKQYLKSNEV